MTDMGKKSALTVPGLLLLAFLPSGCHLTNETGRTFLDIDADTGLLGHDQVLILLEDSRGTDTLFEGKLPDLDTLERLPAPGYAGGEARITIRGFQDGRLVYEERRDYDGSTGNATVSIPFDASRPANSFGSLALGPDRIRLFTGGSSLRMEVHPEERWKDRFLEWSTGNPEVAAVSQAGLLTPVGAGVTYVRAVSGDSAGDALAVTVIFDPPVLDAGASDTILQSGSTASFRVEVVQEYGDVSAFAWDLDGDGAYEDSLAGTAGQALFETPGREYAGTGEVTVRFRMRDGEGNAATASKRVRLSASAPKVESLSILPDVGLTIGDSVAFSASVSGNGSDLRSFAWDFDGDGTGDAEGDLQGTSGTLRAGFRYPDSGVFRAVLRVTDAEGASVAAEIDVSVNLDPPFADAGVDTSVAAGELVNLRGRASDSLGEVKLMEWKIGAGEFAAVSQGDTSFTAPAEPGTLYCVFRVTDDDGQSSADTVRISVAPSSSAELSGLALSSGALSPAFAAGIPGYTATVPHAVSEISFTPTAASAGSTVKVNGAAVASGTASGPIALAVGENGITIVVTAQDGTTAKTYAVNVTRAVSSQARLTGLILSAGMTFNRPFHADTLTYNVTAVAGAAACRFTPSAADSGTTITVDGAAVASGVQSPALAFPYGTVRHAIVVRAPDGVATRTYTINVWRDAPPALMTGYAMVTSVTASRALGSGDWFHNPASTGAIDFVRNGTGRYRVVFKGLAAAGNAEGMVHVSALGEEPVFCKVSDWTSDGDLSAGVSCFLQAGAAMDAPFTILAFFPRGSAGGNNAYVWADRQSVSGSYAPEPGRSWNSVSGFDGNTVQRTAAGSYTITFKGQGSGSDLGNIMLTAHGGNTVRCMVASWTASGGDINAGVTCRNPAGTLTDAQFNASLLKAYAGTDYGVATGRVTGSTDDTRGAYSATNAGAAMAVDNGATGSYSLNLGAMGEMGPGRTSIMVVTSYGAGQTICNPGYWFNFSSIMATVSCFDSAGAPVNAGFNFWFIK